MKKHLAAFRSGWQSENLARYILSNFAFIAHPSTIADDIGSDFFCNIFDEISSDKNNYLVPKESFAIQIKSNARKFSISNKKDYLQSLGVPFFVGVTNKKKKILDVFSGEYLIPFFLDNPNADNIKVSLMKKNISEFYSFSKKSGEFTVYFPHVSTIGLDRDSTEFKTNTKNISRVCRIISNNITRRNNREYIFVDSVKAQTLLVNSDALIQQSLSTRLSNIFMELSYILENNFIDDNLREYEKIRDAILTNLRL
ncbi:conserved hypothetical protein [delta proteobacterium NaphS2]|nr:conserved hypothetical protein [delta proteobacterium NaphS2]